jgi:hypothetical protein
MHVKLKVKTNGLEFGKTQGVLRLPC